ncbi:hypothetical protein L1049_022319 [Liquidambar formosana]|uniref:Helitron helicase-like domain-containing protein n=1 Tax=Liquidambar formosana TaxID=63359 RepID=A0AAP0RCD2_LIQFO
MWVQERTSRSSMRNLEFNLCCQNEKVDIPLLLQTPPFLQELFEGKYNIRSSKFKELTRFYNAMFSFTSMGGKIDRSVVDGRGPNAFRISEGNYHKIGSLLPPQGVTPKFAQLYIHDTHNETQNRISAIGNNTHVGQVNTLVIQGLKSMLYEINPYANVYRSARKLLYINQVQDLRIIILESRGGNWRQYVHPTSDEVAALMVGDGFKNVNHRDIIISTFDQRLQRISEIHPSYMPLQYPLLFPYGEDGWRIGIPYQVGSVPARSVRTTVSIREFYAFRLQYHESEGKTLLQGGRVFQQYVVDAYAAIEEQCLKWVRDNQKTLRAELYQGLQDAVIAGDSIPGAIGRRFILPSSFTGGPRNIIQNYQNAMGICRWAGPPDLFITFTCNPRWTEVGMAISLIPSQRPEDRPNIIARVFKIKLKQLLHDFKVQKMFGTVVADLHVIEFQKRGLPHAHILLTLSSDHKINSAEAIDSIVCAELPNQQTNPLAYEIVGRCMIHGPCGVLNPNAPCMVNGKCTKRYPRDFCDETTFDGSGHPVYRRRNDGNTIVVNNIVVDNRWVIPYNLELVTRFDCHINVEIVSHFRIIKYLYKYIHKGPDRATIVIEDNNVDEIKQYLDCRYISSSEVCWRVFEFDLQQRHPAVERLQYHLEDQQNLIFSDDDIPQDVISRSTIDKTMLTQWFKANEEHPDARNLTYAEFPCSWVWKSEIKKWTIRLSGNTIGRLPFAHPTSGERYYPRMLLHIVRGGTCYKDLRTIDGVEYPTFKDACIALGLLHDDNEWSEALLEANTWAFANQLRHMFATMLMFCEVTNLCDL